MEKKTIAKSLILLSTPKVLKFIFGIIRAKFVAVFLGTAGAGIMDQLLNILKNISVFTSAGLPDGMVVQIASANANNAAKSEISNIIKTFAFTVGVITIIVYGLGFLFSLELTQYVFGGIEYHNYFIIGFSALPIMILSSSSFAIIKAYKRFKSLMFAELIIIGANFVSFIFLIYFYKLTGAVIYVTLSFLTTFFVYYYIAQKKILKKVGINIMDIVKAKFVVQRFKVLLTFTGAILTAGVYEIFVDVTTRSFVVNSIGVDKIGIYSPIVLWAGLFTGFILPSLYIYLFPRISEAKSNKEITSLVNDVFRLMTFAVLPFVLIGITSRNYIIPLFYSSEFQEAGIYLPFHFVGIFFVIYNYCFAQIFAPTGRIKFIVLFSILHNTLTLALVYYLVPNYGLWGWCARFFITPIFISTIYYIFWYKTIKFRFLKENWILLIFVIIISFLTLIFRNDLPILIMTSTIGLSSVWFLVKKNERKFLFDFAKKYLNKIKFDRR